VTGISQQVARPKDEAAGDGYGFTPGRSDEELTRVGKGTPGGELLRRYWWPIAVSADVQDIPLQVRVLGEDLILFRDKRGNAGLVYPRCIHRGTSLFFGRVEEAGIRCCYHGWLFDTQGRTLEMPCEPNGGENLQRYRQPWYPVEERYGLVFAYLGPLEHKPLLPRYELLEDLEDGAYELFVDGHHLISGDPQPDHNWVQKSENVVDPFHVFILHNNMSREQFHHFFTVRPKVTWEYTETGVRCVAERVAEGKVIHRINDLVFPSHAVIGNPLAHDFDRSVIFNFMTPVDDVHTMDMIVIRASPKVIEKVRTGDYARELFPKPWSEMTEEEHQREPSDYEAQVSQGPITLHTEEHLVTSDTGVSMFRRMLRKAIKDVAAGRAPFGVVTDESAPPLKLVGGNYIVGKVGEAANA
jgi:phenylpropionate dioxygenase-like ring-hydroxylating dioxygenase large terminal subunit